MESLIACLSNQLIIPVDTLGRHSSYLFHYKRNIKNLRDKVEELEAKRVDVDRFVQTAQEKGDLIIKQEVKKWLGGVNTVSQEANELKDEADQIDSCFNGWCCSRYQLGKKAKNKSDTVDKLLKQGERYNSDSCVSDPAPPPSIEYLPTADFQIFASRDSVTKQIENELKNENINVVGVYGTPGVGKTILMRELAKKVKTNHPFDAVVMVTVSQNPNLKMIQDNIVDKLGMGKLADVLDEYGRAGRLSRRLKTEKQVLIILDDVWERLDLAMVGIPLGDDHKGCKVVITTRSEDVCNEMDTQKKIKVEVLSENDSWILFRQKAGNNVVDSPLAREVANECKGLPLAVVTVGRALKDKDQIVWREAARQLKTSFFFQGKYSRVYSSIKLSYDHLETEEMKRCFLFCCTFSEDWNINEDELMLYVIGEKLLPNVNTLEDARSGLHRVLDKLMASCLLLKGSEDGTVMMHDVVRDVAISIASEESNRFIVKAGMRLTRWPHEEDLRTCKRMSLMMNEISDLPDDHQPECPQLLSLSLSWKIEYKFQVYMGLRKIPDRFFERMTSLVVLDLSRNGLSSLPPSFSCLVNLRTLCLDDNTWLKDVSLVGKLKKLEMLSLRRTGIESLPKEIGGFINLKLLNFSSFSGIITLPKNIFSSLSRLEELCMESRSKFEMEDESYDGLADQLASLSTFGERLNKFCINLSSREKSVDYDGIRNDMALTITSDSLANWVKVLLKKTDVLRLDECQGLKSIVKLGVGGFDNLKELSIQKCDEMEYLLTSASASAMEDSPETAFSALEKLRLWNMKGLKAIYNGSLPNGFLGRLKILRLDNCNKISNAIPCELFIRLQNLEELRVVKCDEVKEVFHLVGHVSISRLRKMELSYLPKLTTIWKEVTPLVIFQELKSMEVWGCHNLRYIFSRTMVQRLPQLEHLEIVSCNQMKRIINSEEDEEEIVVEGEQYKALLPQLTTLRLEDLPNLSSFYRPNILFDWPSLQELKVFECPNLKMFPLGLHSAPSMNNLKGDSVEWFEGLEWEDQSVKSRLQP